MKVQDGEIISSENDSAMHEEVKETECATNPQEQIEMEKNVEVQSQQIQEETPEVEPIAIEVDCKEEEVEVKEEINEESKTESTIEKLEDCKQEDAAENSNTESTNDVDDDNSPKETKVEVVDLEVSKIDTTDELTTETLVANNEEIAESVIESKEVSASNDAEAETAECNGTDSSSSSSSSDAEDENMEQVEIVVSEESKADKDENVIQEEIKEVISSPPIETIGTAEDINDEGIDEDDLPPPPEDLDGVVASSPPLPQEMDLPPPMDLDSPSSPVNEMKSSYAALVTPSGFVSPTDSDRKTFTNR